MRKGPDFCTLPGCRNRFRARGLCNKHYKRLMAGRSVNADPVRAIRPAIERFWEKVDKEHSSGCWLWTASTDGNGYGNFFEGHNPRRYISAHRWSYQYHKGDVPEGKEIDHVCWTPLCVNPDHLRAVDRSGNQQNIRGAKKTSKTGVRGVYWSSFHGAYRAKAQVQRKSYHLGYFSTIKEAEEVIVAWRKENMPYSLADSK